MILQWCSLCPVLHCTRRRAGPLSFPPMLIDPEFRPVRESRPAANDVRRLLGHHDGWRVEIAVGDSREDRRVCHTQPFDAPDAAVAVQHRQRIVVSADLAST